jgi:hypothetical protein
MAGVSGGGYWLIRVNRENGESSSEFFTDADRAWQLSLDIEKDDPSTYTTVVPRRIPTRRPTN